MTGQIESIGITWSELEHRSLENRRRLAELLLRQASIQYAVLAAFEITKNGPIHTETREPMTRRIGSYLRLFNGQYLNGRLGSFEFQVNLKEGTSDVVVTWDGQSELADLIRCA